MNQPAIPFFLFDRKKHFIDLCEAMEIGKSVSRLTLVSGWDSRCIVYDSAGLSWGFFSNAPDNATRGWISSSPSSTTLYGPRVLVGTHIRVMHSLNSRMHTSMP